MKSWNKEDFAKIQDLFAISIIMRDFFVAIVIKLASFLGVMKTSEFCIEIFRRTFNRNFINFLENSLN